MSTNLHARRSAFRALAATHVADIRQAGVDSWLNLDLSQREERIIHDYFSGRHNSGLKHLNQTIAPLFLAGGFEVKFAGVFCHGHPRVVSYQGTTKSPARAPLGSPCELGDLHLVFVFLDRGKKIRDQRAILFQAKKAPVLSGGSFIAHPDQSVLYETAGGFDYTTMLLGAKRNWPKSRDRDKALHYLFCGARPVQTSSACAPALIDYGELLSCFMSDSEGVYFNLSPKGYPGWWDINCDLLKTVAAAFYKSTARGEYISDVLSNFNSFTNHDHFFFDLGEGGADGIPTLFVIVKDRQLPAEDTAPNILKPLKPSSKT